MTISSEQLTKSSAISIAHIHSEAIKTGFLSTLPISFLGNLYQSISVLDCAVVIVARNELNEITGFVAAAINTDGMYKKIILRKGVLFVLQLLPVAFRLSTLRRILETLFYSITHGRNNKHPVTVSAIELPDAELLSIAVNGTDKGKGIGKELIRTLDEWYKTQGISAYRVATWSEDPASNAFYTACGFILVHKFSHHGNILNEYVKQI